MKRLFTNVLSVLLFLIGTIMFTSCVKDDEEQIAPLEVKMHDGEWTGYGEGRGGTIIVKVIVVNHQIEQVIVASQSESKFAQETISTIISNAVGRDNNLSMEVDAVSGATLTSTGVIDAINMAIDAAMGKSTDSKRKYKDSQCDVVVIGAGGAGLTAAVSAAEADDLRIIVLEKQGIIGGNTNYSTGGINAAETDIQQSLGIEDSKEIFYQDVMRGGHNENVPELVRSLVEHAPATVKWLTTIGTDLSDVGLMAGSSVRRTHRPKGGAAVGPHLIKVLHQAIANRNIEIRTSNKVIGLIYNNGSVAGVRVQNADGSTYTIQSKAVIIATGGFGANRELVARYRSQLSGFPTVNHPGATGDAFAWAEAIGAATIQMENIQIHPTAEKTNHILITEAVRGNGAILLNRNGTRFVNEMETRDVVSAAILQQPSSEALLIFDQSVRQSLSAIETYAQQHILMVDSTWEGLAILTGLPAETLKENVQRYNTMQRNGIDEDFGRTANEMVVALETAPFYAVRVAPAVHHTLGGLKVNPDMQVLDNNDSPIDGLFAAGEVTGGLHGANRLGGNGVADIVVNGRIAGQNAARHCADAL